MVCSSLAAGRLRAITAVLLGGSCAAAQPSREATASATSHPAPATPTQCPCGTATPDAYRHDGYYQRVSVGYGYMSIWGEGPSGSASISGPGVSLRLAFGGTPGEGLAVAGTFGFAGGAGTFEGAPEGAAGRWSGIVPLLGVLVDWYPAPEGPWHVGGSFGMGGYSGRDASGRGHISAAPAGTLFGGYDAWVATQWAMGLALVASLAAPSDAEDQDDRATGYHFMSASVALESSLLWH